MIKAIIFDCFGVLTADEWQEFTATLPAGVRQDVRELGGAYNAGLLDRSEFTNQIAELSGQSTAAVEAVVDGQRNKNTVLLDHIAQLKQSYKIGLLSNVGNNWVRDTLLSTEEQALFDAMVFSFEVGVTKPDQRMFKIACEKLEVTPSEAIMVDDIERYCRAAEALGMNAIVYESYPQFSRNLKKLLKSS